MWGVYGEEGDSRVFWLMLIKRNICFLHKVFIK